MRNKIGIGSDPMRLEVIGHCIAPDPPPVGAQLTRHVAVFPTDFVAQRRFTPEYHAAAPEKPKDSVAFRDIHDHGMFGVEPWPPIVASVVDAGDLRLAVAPQGQLF